MTPEELKKRNDLIKEGIELAKKLGLVADEASLRNFNGDLVQAERLVQSLRDEWKDYIKDIAGAREGFARILDEIKGINSGVTRSKNAFSGLTSLAAKLQSHVEGTNKLSTKELEKLKQQTKQREDDLKLAGKLAKDRVKELEYKDKLAKQGIGDKLSKQEKKDLKEARIAHQNISQEITRNAGHLKQFNAQLDETIKASEKIDDNLGLAGKLIKDVGKLPIVGSFIDSAKVLEDATKAAGEKGATKASTMKAAFKSAGSSLKENLMDPTAMTLGLMKMMWETLMGADKATGDLAKSMNMTYDAASKTRQDLTQLSNSTLDASVNTLRLQESMVAIGNSLGTNAKLNEADLVTMTKLREKAGLTNEELIGMQKITLATGGNLKENTEQFLGSAKALSMQKGLAINVKQLMRETANTSNATKLSLVGGAKGLAEAAVQAKALGTSLDQVDKIAGSLLNFEDSISAELEAELLTGKQINLETARLAALNGDLATVAEEINNQIGGSAEFSKMNRIQQEAFAKSVGMSREELANSLVEQEALAAIGRDLSKEEQAAYEAAKKQYGEKEAAKMLAEGQLEDMMHQQSIQDRLNDSILKMKEVLVSIADPLLQMISPIVDILQPALMGINMILGAIGNAFSFIGEKVSAIIGPLGTVGKILKYVAGLAVVYAAYKAYSSLATIPIAGVPLGIAAAAAVTTAGFGLLNSVKDAKIDTKKGPIMTGEFGSVQLDPNDKAMYGADGKIKVGTDLLGGNNGGGGGGTISIDYDRMASAIASAVAKVQINTSVKVNEREIASGVNNENLKGSSKLQ
jgi:hypothetical protein